MELLDLAFLKEKGIEKDPFGHDFVYRFPESKNMPSLDSRELGEAIAGWGKKSLAFYFHIPFCSKECNFCHYYKESKFSRDGIEKYLVALKGEIAAYSTLIQGDVEVQSVFFGGGTPTLLQARELNELLAFLREKFPFMDGTEVSIESSPETLNRAKLSALRTGGFNRLSIGAQSFDEKVLKKAGRAHTPKQVKDAVSAARAAGFDNINMDLLYGLPGQSSEGWNATIEQTLALELESVTASDLRVQKNTPNFYITKSEFPAISEMRKMYYAFAETFEGAGFVQQFPYQFVKKGREMNFLENQWSSGEFVGFGASSCSFIAGYDFNNALGSEEYLKAVGENGISASQGKKLLGEEAEKRFVALGLKKSGLNRKNAGINKAKFEQRFGKGLDAVFGRQIEELESIGLVKSDNSGLALLPNGLFFHDEVARKFLYE